MVSMPSDKRMTISVEGKVRRRSRSGRGLFRIERWHDAPFKVAFCQEDIVSADWAEVGEHIELCCEQQGNRVFVKAEVNRKPFVLGEIEVNQVKAFTFSILSVSGYEVTGKVNSKV
jgi:hypothetical protein